jgi:uncharacterized membrane protein
MKRPNLFHCQFKHHNVKTFVGLEVQDRALSSAVLETEVSDYLRSDYISDLFLSPLYRKIPDIYCMVNPLEFRRDGKEEKLFFKLYNRKQQNSPFQN